MKQYREEITTQGRNIYTCKKETARSQNEKVEVQGNLSIVDQ